MEHSAENYRVSICVANYNGQFVIRRCLESILAQDTGAEIEIIVHDDASSDDSIEIARIYCPSAIIVLSDENVGFCRANNRMVEAASGDFILLLNNDAWLATDAVRHLLSAALAKPSSILTLPQLSSQGSVLLDCGMSLDLFANPIPIVEKREQEVATVMGACLWLPKPLWYELGGFPEWFESIGEDLYLCQYARLLGCRVIALQDSAYYHDVGGSFGGGKVLETGLQTTLRRRRLSERNKLYVIILFYPWPLLLPVLPIQVLLLFFEGLVLALVKREFSLFSEIYFNAITSSFSNLPRLLSERARIQQQRKIGTRKYLSVFRWMPYKLAMLLKHGLPRVD